MASTTQETRAAGATLGMKCLTNIEYGNCLSGEVTFSLVGTESHVKYFYSSYSSCHTTLEMSPGLWFHAAPEKRACAFAEKPFLQG